MNSQTSILVGEVRGILWIRIEGKASFESAPGLKRLLASLQKDQAHVVIDLENCPVMDSTFLGTLTGAAIRLRGLGGGITIVNVNLRNQQLLQSLGLDQFMNVDLNGEQYASERASISGQLNRLSIPGFDKQEVAAVLLEANETLSQANEENVVRFKDVIEYLRQDTNLG